MSLSKMCHFDLNTRNISYNNKDIRNNDRDWGETNETLLGEWGIQPWKVRENNRRGKVILKYFIRYTGWPIYIALPPQTVNVPRNPF